MDPGVTLAVWLQIPILPCYSDHNGGTAQRPFGIVSAKEGQKELQQGYTMGTMRRAFAQLIHTNEHLICARHCARLLGDTAVNNTGKNPCSCGAYVPVCMHRAIEKK